MNCIIAHAETGATGEVTGIDFIKAMIDNPRKLYHHNTILHF
ncbi:hypothetical protein [Arcicella rosea]|uniref:Ubiquinone/menaquinone biosynthesis C-methylase UbiE n=1 Tax=Arcicella rosea TaxID=502909 RepID=A0A841EYP9_9BACT|nr:hypothetical protein [Arcicella rosea]MBB6005748.1 ubiquinone/menaquinone biosynthesis C-methylase UbiE [Arcicella rosea]